MNIMRITPMDTRKSKKRTIFDIHYLWYLFTHNKRWFALSLILCLCCAAAYIYFVHPAYSVTGKLLITEKRNSSAVSNASLLLQNQLPFNLGSSLGGSIGVENEKEILRSRLLSRKVVKRLGLYTEYRHYYGMKGRLLYKGSPVNVLVNEDVLDMIDNSLPMTRYQIDLSIYKNAEGYRVEGKLKENKKKIIIPEQTFKTLPATIQTEIGRLALTENKTLTSKQAKRFNDDYRLDVRIVPPLIAANKFSNRLSFNSAAKKATNTVNLNMNDESILRGIDYINTLAEEYNDLSTEEKHKEVRKYDEFVRTRLKNIDVELGLTDENWASYKQQFKVTEPKVDAEEVIMKKSEYEAQLVGLGIQLQLLEYLKEYVDDPSNIYEIIPVNMGLFSRNTVSASSNGVDNLTSMSTGDAVNVIGRHNALVDERNQLLKSSTIKSPQVQKLTVLLEELHPVIQKALGRDIRSIELRRNGLEREFNKYLSRVSDAPQQERVLTDIGRQRKVQEGVYITLLQKREENAMDLMNSVDKGRLIDVTQYNKKAKPIIWLVVLITLFISIVIPYAFLFLARLLRKKIRDYDDVDSLTRFPMLGMVSQDHEKVSSFCMIRNSLLHQMTEDQKVIMVTSFGEGEGKSYVSIGVADALCAMGKKVILCDLGLYHPSLSKTQGKGWCDLVLNNSVAQEDVKNIIQTSTTDSKVDILPAGEFRAAAPGNLIAHDHLKSILAILRVIYDYVLLDTSAVGLHGDALVDGLADVSCIVCRSCQVKKAEVEYMNQLGETKRLPDPMFILNDVRAE